jgi:hypothetical protein
MSAGWGKCAYLPESQIFSFLLLGSLHLSGRSASTVIQRVLTDHQVCCRITISGKHRFNTSIGEVKNRDIKAFSAMEARLFVTREKLCTSHQW